MSDSAAPERPIQNWHSTAKAKRSLGERSADRLRNSMGSWPFVFSFIGIMIVWATLNSFPIRWDPYPFILLNLFLSMLAGLQGAILLIAAKRQDAISAALSQHDFDTNVAAKKEIENLTKINERQIKMLDDLHAILVSSGISAKTVSNESASKAATD